MMANISMLVRYQSFANKEIQAQTTRLKRDACKLSRVSNVLLEAKKTKYYKNSILWRESRTGVGGKTDLKHLERRA